MEGGPLDGGICVFTPGLLLTVTVEASANGDEIHFHPGGQGYWMARAIDRLGERVALCAGVGGEVGDLLVPLLATQTTIRFVDVRLHSPSPAYVHDRRAGHREEFARMPAPVLDRHTTDKLYSLTLAHAAELGWALLAGNRDCAAVPTSMYVRLCADFKALGVDVTIDLHGPELDALVGAGAIDLIKLSEDDLRDDDLVRGEGDAPLADAIAALGERGDFDLVVTRGPDRPAVARLASCWYTVRVPRLAAVDWRGSGDAMAGALTVGRRRHLPPVDILRFASAAGAASVTRRGLASLDALLVDQLARHVEVEQVTGPTEATARC